MRAEPRHKPLPPEAAALLDEGRIGAAIRSLRRSHDLDLRRAQEWIDEHIDHNPMLRTELETRQRAVRRKFFFWFLLVDAVIAAAIIWYLLNFRAT
jgi:hypothetical protein